MLGFFRPSQPLYRVTIVVCWDGITENVVSTGRNAALVPRHSRHRRSAVPDLGIQHDEAVSEQGRPSR